MARFLSVGTGGVVRGAPETEDPQGHRERPAARADKSPMDPAGLPALLDAIRHMHGCEARWVESVPVHEVHEGQTVWDGEVQVFDLVGHPKARRAYAWSHATEDDRRRFHAVLGMPPVDSPAMAVRTAALAEYRARN